MGGGIFAKTAKTPPLQSALRRMASVRHLRNFGHQTGMA